MLELSFKVILLFAGHTPVGEHSPAGGGSFPGSWQRVCQDPREDGEDQQEDRDPGGHRGRLQSQEAENT